MVSKVLGRSISRVEIGHKGSTNSTRLEILQRRWRTKTLLPISKNKGYKMVYPRTGAQGIHPSISEHMHIRL